MTEEIEKEELKESRSVQGKREKESNGSSGVGPTARLKQWRWGCARVEEERTERGGGV